MNDSTFGRARLSRRYRLRDDGRRMVTPAPATHHPSPITIGGREFAWGSRTYVMGIVNVTPDSFSGDGLAHDVERRGAPGGADARGRRRHHRRRRRVDAAGVRGGGRGRRDAAHDAGDRTAGARARHPGQHRHVQGIGGEGGDRGGRDARERRARLPARAGDRARRGGGRRAGGRDVLPPRPRVHRHDRQHRRRAAGELWRSPASTACRTSASSSTPASTSAGRTSRRWRCCAGSASCACSGGRS